MYKVSNNVFTGCSLNIVFFPRIPESSIALRALMVSYSDLGEGGVAVNCEKTQFFLNTLYVKDLLQKQPVL